MSAKDREFAQTFSSSLIDLVKAQRFAEATSLLDQTNVGPEPDGSNGRICELLGDQFYTTDKAAAEWFYRESLRRLEKFADGATSSADAIARRSVLAPVDEKLRYLCSGAAWPYEIEIPEDVVLGHFLRWAETCCLRDFANQELNNPEWRAQSARVIAFLEDPRSPREMVYQIAYISLRLYLSYFDATGILASWLRLALPRLAARRSFTPELEDTCRMVARDEEPDSEEIAALVKDYLRAADEAPARDSQGYRRQRSLLTSAASTEEDLVENLLDRARDRSSMGNKLRGLRAGSPEARSRFLAQFVNRCPAEEACELIYLLVSQGQVPQGRAAGTLGQWGGLLFAAIERRGLRAPDMVRHCYQGLVGSDFPAGLRRQIVKFLLAYGSKLDGYREYVISAFGYSLYSSGTDHKMTLPARPKTWHDWEHEGWAICDYDWPPAVLLFALDPPAEREMLDVLEAPLDAYKPSPMFLPSLVLHHLWKGAGLGFDGFRAVARHMEIARRMDHSSFLYLFDRAVLVFHKWWALQPAAEDAGLVRSAAEVAKALAGLEARLGPQAAG